MKFEIFEKDLSEEYLQFFLNSELVAVDIETTGLNLHRDQICLVQISDGERHHAVLKIDFQWVPDNLSKLLSSENTKKVFHHAIFDCSMIQADLGIVVKEIACTKVMSKVVRTYTSQHKLADLSAELIEINLDKTIRESCWFRELSIKQCRYAVDDVIRLIDIYKELDFLIEARGDLRSGYSCRDVNNHAQKAMSNMIPLLVSGYGSPDNNWDLGWIFKY